MGGGKGGDGAKTSCLTLFGLPYDCTEREVRVLFSSCEGFQRCILNPGKGSGRPYAFVQFTTPEEALEAKSSREGTTWEDGEPGIAIEMAKRDIPDTFGSRVVSATAPVTSTTGGGYGQSGYGPAGYGSHGLSSYAVVGSAPYKGGKGGKGGKSATPPPNGQGRIGQIGGSALLPLNGGARHVPQTVKRPVQTSLASPWESSAHGYRGQPRTLHITGLPGTTTQDELDTWLNATFNGTCLGSNLDLSMGANSPARAFVGFTTHEAAEEARSIVDGSNWDEAVLKAEWARTEYRPKGAGKGDLIAAGGSGRVADASDWTTPAAQSHQNYQSHPQGFKTLHFTNLPHVAEADFEEFLASTFAEQVITFKFKDDHDGRPPVAWVLFKDEITAADTLESHQLFTWGEAEVQVKPARTELDPNKARRLA